MIVTPPTFEQNLSAISTEGIKAQILKQIPSMPEEETPLSVRSTPEPLAFDLSDELRRMSQMQDPKEYHDFFKLQAEFYIKETYAKSSVVDYAHQLVNDNGEIRLWIDPMNRSARSSYYEAANKAEGWYRDRCLREAEGVELLENLINQYPGGVFIDISPTPLFDFPEEDFDGTNFGTHSFLRFHQIKYDENKTPYLHSVAHRVETSSDGLEALANIFMEEGVSTSDMLGFFQGVNPTLEEVELDTYFSSRVKYEIEKAEKLFPIKQEDVSAELSEEEIRSIFESLEPYLDDVFGKMLTAASESDMQRIIEDFRAWEGACERLIINKKDGQQKPQESSPIDMSSQEVYALIMQSRSTQYNPGGNSCGTGAGASGFDFAENSTQSKIIAPAQGFGLFSHRSLTEMLKNMPLIKGKEACVTCPHCKNKTGNSQLKDGTYVCGNINCESNLHRRN